MDNILIQILRFNNKYLYINVRIIQIIHQVFTKLLLN
jgi:hypothetical protein